MTIRALIVHPGSDLQAAGLQMPRVGRMLGGSRSRHRPVKFGNPLLQPLLAAA